ncbi:deleted in malignant brain tumors 1 protein-like [Saccostrea cucullata]|uniref:deleted in malignant brain tumors 1 protein-like n=1 Tax=Saccostrea cuccullata TaxID=36930 RepID=UPI002ED66C14
MNQVILMVIMIFGCFKTCKLFMFNNDNTTPSASVTKDVTFAVLAQEMLQMKASIKTCESRIQKLEDGTGNLTSMTEFQNALKKLNDLEQLMKSQANETMVIKEKLQQISAQSQAFNPTTILASVSRLQGNISFVESSLLSIQSAMAAMAEKSTFVDTIFVPNRLRLVGGDQNSGRVEYLINGTWNAICTYGGFDNNAAKVICRMLGRPWQNALAYLNSEFGDGSVPMHLYDVQCSGHEVLLEECHHAVGSTWHCYGHKQAGVRCQ